VTARPTFGVSFATLFATGVRGYRANLGPLSVAAAATILVYAAFRVPAQMAFSDDRLALSIGLDLVGLWLAGTIAYPWYSYALDTADGEPVDIKRPFLHLIRFRYQAAASFWFWAGILLGLRYLFGLLSVLVLVFYCFYGFTVADGSSPSGVRALGRSVYLGEGRRIGIMALGGVFLIFNLFGAIALGFAVNPLTIVLAVLGLVATTSVTLVAGAQVYRVLERERAAT